MTNKESEKEKQRLIEINKMGDFQERKRQLKELAREVGAGQARYFVKGNEDTLSELTDNIHQALKTKAMIEMCKIASRNYKIALVAAMAAWAAVLAMFLIAAFTK